MSGVLTWVTLLAFVAVGWMYVGYGVFVTLLARNRPHRHSPDTTYRPLVSILIMTYNEQDVIEAKLENTLQLDYPRELLEVLVVDSASTDATVGKARTWEHRGVRVIAQPERAGKASAIDYGLVRASGEIVIVTDANAMMAPDVLRHIVPHFADPRVGGVTGAMQQRDRSGTAESAAGDLYWRIEKRLRTAESKLHSVVGMSGEISAYRRHVFLDQGQPVSWYTEGGPDDLDQTIYLIRHGFRVLYEPAALVWEPAPDNPHDIADQKVRVITMTIATVRHRFWSLLRWRYGWYGLLTFPSRKMLPLFSPWLLIIGLISSLWLSWLVPVWFVVSLPLVLVLCLGFLALASRALRALPVVKIFAFFVALNLYVVRAWAQYLRGHQYKVWDKVQSTRSALVSRP